jgi:hypothetical protein
MLKKNNTESVKVKTGGTQSQKLASKNEINNTKDGRRNKKVWNKRLINFCESKLNKFFYK